MRQFPQSRSSDDDESQSTNIRDEIERQEDDQLNNLNNAPWRVDGRACGLPQHLDRRRRIVKKNPMGRNKALQSEFDESSLAKQ